MVEHRRFQLQRYRQIADTLARHGLGVVVVAVGLKWLAPLQRGPFRSAQRSTHTTAEHLRLALEELGATFIKLVQVLSTRADLLPPEYQRELAKLQDSAPPVPWPEIEAAIVQEFGTPVTDLFASFDEEPLAAASIGQAHAATLPGGQDVVVKVRRPGVVGQVEADLEILRNLARRAERNWQPAEEYDLLGLVEEFSNTLRAELDYVREGRNAERFAANFAGEAGIHIPAVHWDLTTSRVITLERIRGIKISDVESLDQAGIDRPALAERSAGLLLKMVFEDGFFHADPHPGNFFIEPDGTVGLVDYGMVGFVDEPTRRGLVTILTAVASQDTASLVDALLDLGVSSHHVDRAAIQRDLQRFLDRYYNVPLADYQVREVISDVMSVIRDHRLHLPANLSLLVKTTVMAEGLGTMLNPSFQLPDLLEPYARRFVLQQFEPAALLRLWGRTSLDAAQLGAELPRRMRRILTDVEEGRLQMGVRPESFDPVLDRLERLINRMILGMIASALILGTAIMLSFYRPPGWGYYDGPLFALGLLSLFALAAYLAWSFIRSRGR